MTAILTVTLNPCVDLSSEVERILPHSKLRCGPLRRDPGGGGINVARVCMRLGASATALFSAGGPTGAVLRELVAGEGLESFPLPIAGDTRESFTIQETSSNRQFRFLFPGPRLTAEEGEAFLAALAERSEKPQFVVASGSLAEGLDEGFFARLAAAARELGAAFALDSHGPALRAAVEAGGIDILKLNLRELRELVGAPLESEAEQRDAAERLVASGHCRAVTLTLGASGAHLCSAEGSWRAEGLSVEISSAVGAGDSFVGGFLAGLVAGQDLPEAFRQAVAAGTAALLTPGTELCHAEDVRSLLTRVVMTKLEV